MVRFSSDYLVLGATGSIGYAFTQELLNQGIQTTILVRSKQKASSLFPATENLEIFTGDVKDPELLKKVANGKKVILHAINYPYHQWKGNMEVATRNIIEAAAVSKATILFPGNIYNFGNILGPILEDTPDNPSTKKGKIRVQIEQMLKEAATNSFCRVIILRLPDFWGPNVVNGLMAPIFENALKKKPMPWMVRTDIPHQLVYIMDAGKLMVRLAKEKNMSGFEVFNFGGTTVQSVASWLNLIAKCANSSSKVRTYPKFMISLLGLFIPLIREVNEMTYLFENSIILNDDKIKALYPDFKPPDMDIAIQKTLDWFKKNRL